MSGNYLINLNNCDFYNFKEKLDSPRSLEACYSLGIDVKDLYYKDLYKFKLDNPDILTLSKESQILRWEHHEKRRNEYLQALIEIRQRMKDENELNNLASYNSSKVFVLIFRKEVNPLLFLE